jgi:hypothetical protein
MRASMLTLIVALACPAVALDHMIADITEPVEGPFATYYPIPVEVDPCVEPWEIAPDLSNVANGGDFDFSEAEESLLVANGFLVVPQEGLLQAYDLYNENRDNDIPSFVTADALLHIYHTLFDHLLKQAELLHFVQTLAAMNDTLLGSAVGTYHEASHTALESAAKRLLGLHAVVACLLDSTYAPPAEVAPLVGPELSYIRNHAGVFPSPLFGYDEDYTQYQVRGHYTTNDTLTPYFAAMMWYGRITFILDSLFLDQNLVRDHTRSALLLVRDMAKHPETQPLWHTIYWPTAFFVGRADDLTYDMYAALAEQVYGTTVDEVTLQQLADDALLEEFIEQARAAFPLPEISNASWQGLRFMGQRFIPDSYVLEHLVYPHVPARTTPRGLDVVAALGSDRALWLLENVYGEFQDPTYVSQLYEMRTYMESVPDSTWASNLYYNWTYCLMPLLFEKGEGWPPFTFTTAWADRELSSSLSSWTQLRHDTILYAKQSYTLGAPPPGALIHGYVEPNPHLWSRLASLGEFTHAGLDGLNLLRPPDSERLIRLEHLCTRLLDISTRELLDQPLLPSQDSLIAAIGNELQVLTNVEDDDLIVDVPDYDDWTSTALVADVHTDLITGRCLEEGVGYPWNLYVIVRRSGLLYITRGVFLPYYEFTLPISGRLADEEWQQMLESETPPRPPVWSGSFRDTTASLVNAYPDHYMWERREAPRFSFSLDPAQPDTGQTVAVQVCWNPYLEFPPVPQLTVVSPSGDSLAANLQPQGGYLYTGTFSTHGWQRGGAVLWFQGTCYSSILLDWRVEVEVGTASGTGPGVAPERLCLVGFCPNPTSSGARVSFALPANGPARLSLWDIAGRERAVLRRGHSARGHHVVVWDGTGTDGELLPAGAYVVRLTWEHQRRSRVVVIGR